MDAEALRALYMIHDRLIEIAALLKKADDEVARCDHGATGVCMSCVIRNDLLRPR